MNFKEWYLLSEMPHLRMPNTPVNGVVGDIMDLRAEDWGSIPVNYQGPWAAKTQEGWIIHDGKQELNFVPELGESEKQLAKLPADWWRFAVVLDSNRIVKSSNRVVHGGPQSLEPQKVQPR